MDIFLIFRVRGRSIITSERALERRGGVISSYESIRLSLECVTSDFDIPVEEKPVSADAPPFLADALGEKNGVA